MARYEHLPIYGKAIEDLEANTAYHYRLMAYNDSGTAFGDDKTFTTLVLPAAAPSVTTEWANAVGSNTAKLNGTLNPNGADATYYFQYGKTTIYGSATPQATAGSGNEALSVSAAPTGLEPNTLYHFRLVGTNSLGTRYGTDESFTTGKTPRAIIVAGGGPYAGNHIWDATEKVAACAFRALLQQGYTKETIYFLSSNMNFDVDWDGNPDVDNEATNANLENAIKSLAQLDCGDLLLYLVDHGGVGNFRVSPTDNDILLATDLDRWLDDAQNAGIEKVVMLYDACHAGSFVEFLSPPDGKERILATSAGSDENSLFSNEGRLSFSYSFWAHIFNGAGFWDAFVGAKNNVEIAFNSRMKPAVEGKWDGVYFDKEDKLLAGQVKIGSGIMSAADPPRVGSVSSFPQTVYVGSSSVIFAENVEALAGVGRVWAVITPPDYAVSSDNPVSDLPIVDLSRMGDRYEGTYGGFSTEGTYNIVVFVEDQDGFLSSPVQTVVNSISVPTTTTTTTTTTSTTTTTTTTTLSGPTTTLSALCPDCSGGVVTKVDFPIGVKCNCTNSTALVVGPDVTIPSGAEVTFSAPSVTVGSGVHVERGSVVEIKRE